MPPNPELLEIAHRLLYAGKAPCRLAARTARAADCLAILRTRGIGEGEIPGPEQLAAQAAICARRGIGAVYCGEDAYPSALRDLECPPPVLFYRGRLPESGRRRVGIVGSRRASRAGLEIAARMGRGVAAAGLPVVSGMARGIDQAAQRACLEGGSTWAVLGCGLDRVYPPEAGLLAARIREAGGLLSEFPPACPPLPFHFPRRNRIIAALSGALLVVEAGPKSGALGTARAALALGRELGVVPSSPINPSGRGSNHLLREGATPVLGPDDLLAMLGMKQLELAAPAPWTPDRCAREGIEDLQTLAARSGWLLTEAIEAVARWERSGEVIRLAGGRFRIHDVARSPGPD